MNALHDANWIQIDPQGGWLLSRDLSEMTLMDLYRIIPNRIRLQSDRIGEDDETVQLKQLLQSYNDNLNELFTIPFKTVFPTGMEPDETAQEGHG